MDGEGVAVEVVEAFEGFDEEVVDGEPDGAAPVGVSAEEGALGFAGFVVDLVGVAGDVELVGLIFEGFGDGADAPRGEEFVFVEDALEDALESFAGDDGEEEEFAGAVLARFDLDVLGEGGAVFEEPLEAGAESFETVEDARVDEFDGEEGDDTDHGAEADGEGGVTWFEDSVVVETVLIVPEAMIAEGVDAIDDLDEVFEEFGGDVFVDGVLGGEFDGDGEHDSAVEGHPCGAIGLGEEVTVWEGLRAVEEADVIEAEEAAGEEVTSVDIFAVDPPGEVDEEFEEAAFEEGAVALVTARGDFVDAPAGPGVDWGVDVVEVPLVGGEFSGGVHVPFAEEEFELVFGEVGIDFGHGEHVEGEVPSGEPGVFPFIGHGEDIGGVEVLPGAVAEGAAVWRWWGLEGVTGEPFWEDETVVLFGPEEASEGLAEDEGLVLGEGGWGAGGVEGVGFFDTEGEGLVEEVEGVWESGEGEGAESEVEGGGAEGLEEEGVRDTGAGTVGGVGGGGVLMEEGALDSVFDVGGGVWGVVEVEEVGVIFGEEG